MGKSNNQLCWTCQNACGNCPWSHNLTPIENWQAEKTTIKGFMGEKLTSYKIKQCPLYVPDDVEIPPLLNKTNKQLASELNLSLRTYFRYKKNGKLKKLVESMGVV